MVKHLDKLTRLHIPFDPSTNLSEGCLNFVYRGTHRGELAILKLYNSEFDLYENRFRNELQILDSSLNIKKPKLLDYSKKDRWIISTFIEGESLKQRQARKGRTNVISLVDSLKEIHSCEIDMRENSSRHYLDNFVSQLRERLETSGLEDPLSSSAKKAIKYLDTQKGSLKDIGLCRVNGDCNGSNILLNREGDVKTIVDWEFSHIGNKYLDLAQLTNREDEFAKEIQERYFQEEMNRDLYDFFLTCFLTKITINNSPKNFKKMTFQRKEKIKIVQSKSNRLMEMF